MSNCDPTHEPHWTDTPFHLIYKRVVSSRFCGGCRFIRRPGFGDRNPGRGSGQPERPAPAAFQV